MTVINALTVDVEDYFHIHAFSDVIRREDWDSFEPRVELNTYRILDLLDSHNGPRTTDRGHGEKPRATFFILGWVAERYPTLVKEIHARGHEVACHGYSHERIFKQTKTEFREDVRRAKEILEDLTGVEIIGYRAPTYSINKATVWALEILFELGFWYDSSIFPIKHDFYGFPESPRFPFLIEFSDGDILSQIRNPKYLHEIVNDINTNNEKSNNPVTRDLCPMPHAPCPMPASGLFEFPISTIRFFRRNYPFSGGGYFRLFPYWLTKRGFQQLNGNGGYPVIFYIHPWELDPDLPNINSAARLSRFRTYVNLSRTTTRLLRLLNEFSFVPLAAML